MEIQNTQARTHAHTHRWVCEHKNLQINIKILLVQKIYSKGTGERKERSAWGEAVQKAPLINTAGYGKEAD